MRRALGLMLLLACVTPAHAFSLLGHRIIAQRVLADVRQHPADYDPFLTRVAADATLTQYFLAGTEAPDLGALPAQHPAIQYSTHYEHPGLWAKTLFTFATTDAERAYAWGWIVHMGADHHVHQWMDAQGLNYCDGPLAHVVFEAAMDALIAHAYAAQGAFTNTRRATHATRLLLDTTTMIAKSSAPITPAYAVYLDRLRRRCAQKQLAPSTGITTSWEEVDLASDAFDLVKTAQLYGATVADETQQLARQLHAVSTTATSPFARTLAARLASALDTLHPLALAGLRTADNAELVGLYGFAGGPIRQALDAARNADWHALDHNLDTGEAVYDPALDTSPTIAEWDFLTAASSPVLENHGGSSSRDGMHLTPGAFLAAHVPQLSDVTSFTIEVVFRLNALPRETEYLVGQGTDGRAHFVRLFLVPHGDACDVRGELAGEGGSFSAQTAPVFRPGVWHHVAMTFDGARLHVYDQGALVAEAAASGVTGFAPASESLYFGRHDWPSGHSERLDVTYAWARITADALLADELRRTSFRRLPVE
jgi:hypothetical protein